MVRARNWIYLERESRISGIFLIGLYYIFFLLLIKAIIKVRLTHACIQQTCNSCLYRGGKFDSWGGYGFLHH